MTQGEMKQSMYEINIVKNKYYPIPCKGNSKIDFELTEFDIEITTEDPITFQLIVGFPDQMKIIRQSQAVDINAFIGNIGGYIGLFLGNFILLIVF